MKRKYRSIEKKQALIDEIDVLVTQGKTIGEAEESLGLFKMAYYKFKKDVSGETKMKVTHLQQEPKKSFLKKKDNAERCCIIFGPASTIEEAMKTLRSNQ